MNHLTIVEKDGPRVDTRDVAERLGNVAQAVAANAMAGAVDHHDGYENAKRALGDLGRALEGPRKRALPHAA